MEYPPLKGSALVLLTIALGLGTFIQILDSSIANVSIPAMAGDLAVSPNQGTWVITSFAVSNAIVLPLTGWLSKRFGEVKLFTASTALFSLASWLCGLSWNLPALVFFRTLQGAVAGALIPLSQSLLTANYPPDKRGLALGLWGMIVIVAPILGPILGGWITDNYGWPWIFYINIPLGILSAYMTHEILSNRETKILKIPIDFVGFTLLIIAVASLQITLDKGNDLDWFGSIFIRVLAIVAVLSFISFVVWNSFSDYPVVEFSFFKSRNFVLGTLAASVGFMLFFGSAVLLPLWLQNLLGYTAYWAGVAVSPIGIATIFLSFFVGRYMNLVDLRLLSSLSFILLGVTSLWFGYLNSEVSLEHLMIVRFAQGFGLAVFFIPLVSLSLSEIPQQDTASASGIFNFIRILFGSGIGTAIFITAWDRRHIFHHARLAEEVNDFRPPSREIFNLLQGMGLNQEASRTLVDNLTRVEAFTLATNDIFWISGWIFLLIVPFLWLTHRVSKNLKLQIAGE